MPLTGWHNGNEMRNAICVDTQSQLSGPAVYSLYCDNVSEKKEHCFRRVTSPVLVKIIANFEEKYGTTQNIEKIINILNEHLQSRHRVNSLYTLWSLHHHQIPN